MVSKNWKELLESFSPKWREIICQTEMSAYEALRRDTPESSRKAVTRYTVMLAMASIFLYHRPEMLQDYSGRGRELAAIGLDKRSNSCRNLASTFEGLDVPEDVADSHHRLVRALRDHAAIDRRSAAEVRVRGDLASYISGEAETKSVSESLRSLVVEMMSILRVNFLQGEFERLFVRTISDLEDAPSTLPDTALRDSRKGRES